MDPGTDGEVIAQSLADPAAFAAIYDRHAGTVFRFLVRRVGRETADELVGDVFRIAFERRPTFDLRCLSARPWLYGIATNLVARHRRAEARRLRAISRLASHAKSSTFGADSHADATESAVEAEHRWPLVAHAIAGLPDGERDALLLYAWEELTYEEIAAALGIPVGTVRSRLNRARRRLRELASPVGELPARMAP